MNVLFLSEQLYPHGGGAELATYLYAKLLSQNGIKIKVITNRFPGEKDVTRSGNMEIFRLHLFDRPTALKYSLSLKFPLLFSSFLHRLIRWSDVVYIPLYWYSAIPLAKAYRKPVVIHLHNYLLSCPLATLYNFAEKSICRKRHLICPTNCIFSFEKISDRSPKEILLSTMLNSIGKNYIEWLASMGDALICVSNAQKKLTMQTCGKIFWRKFHVIYNPIPKIPYVDVNGDDFGYFGGPNIFKGFLVLYQAMKILNGYKRKGLIVHATKFQNFPNKEILRNIGFRIYGKLDEFEYENLYKHIRAVIIPSIWEEPLPYVVAEALMKGKLLIASNVGGINEMVNGCSGTFLFEPNDYEHLCELIEYVDGLDKQEIIEMGAKNRETFSKKFSNEKALMDFVYVLEKVACH